MAVPPHMDAVHASGSLVGPHRVAECSAPQPPPRPLKWPETGRAEPCWYVPAQQLQCNVIVSSVVAAHSRRRDLHVQAYPVLWTCALRGRTLGYEEINAHCHCMQLQDRSLSLPCLPFTTECMCTLKRALYRMQGHARGPYDKRL